jgi:hypothetical protein
MLASCLVHLRALLAVEKAYCGYAHGHAVGIVPAALDAWEALVEALSHGEDLLLETTRRSRRAVPSRNTIRVDDLGYDAVLDGRRSSPTRRELQSAVGED